MGVGLNDPFQLEAPLLNLGNQHVGMAKRNAASGIIDVHDTVDNRTGIRGRVRNDITDRCRRLVVKTLYIGLHAQVHWVAVNGRRYRVGHLSVVYLD